MSHNMTIEEKLNILKKNYRTSPNDTKSLIQGFEDSIIKLRLKDEWLKHPNTAELKQTLINGHNEISIALANNPELGDIERRALFRVKQTILTLLAALTANPEAELASINKQLDYEL